MANLIYIVSIDHHQSKTKCSSYADYCINTWQYWCSKNNVDLIVEKIGDEKFGKAMWNKTNIAEIGKKYKKIGIVDTDTMIRWDSPNIFEMYDDEFCGVVDTSDYRWILNSIDVYNKFFPDVKLNVDNYINSGVMFFTSDHLFLFDQLQKFYFDNKYELDNWSKGGGKDQTLINYHLTKNKVKQKILDPCWNLISIHRKDMFKHNWQLNNDPTLYFIKYAYIWHFTGFPVEHRESLMRDTWDIIKERYK